MKVSLEALQYWKEAGKVVLLFAVCLLTAVLTMQVLVQPKQIGRAAGGALKPFLKETTATVKDTHESVVLVKNLLQGIKTDYENNEQNLAANSEATTVLIKSLTDTVMDTHLQLFGGQDCRPTKEKLPNGWARLDCKEVAGLFPQANQLMVNLNAWVPVLEDRMDDLLDTAKPVLVSTNEDLRQLKTNLEKLATLEDQITKDLVEDNTQVVEDLKTLNKTLGDLDKLVADENLQKTIAGLSKSSYHLGETFETVDIATRDLRKKAGRIKWVITTILNTLKATVRVY